MGSAAGDATDHSAESVICLRLAAILRASYLCRFSCSEYVTRGRYLTELARCDVSYLFCE